MSRIFHVAVFAILYLTLVIVFALRVGKWDNRIAGHCYHYNLIALPNSSHPYVDKIYLGITCFYTFASLAGCLFFDKHAEAYMKRTDPELFMISRQSLFIALFITIARFVLISTALLQYPLHLYMAIAIRVSNQAFLQGESENKWGFGQVAALALLAPVIKECGTGYISMLVSAREDIYDQKLTCTRI